MPLKAERSGSEKLKTKNYKTLEILVLVFDFRARSGSENQKLLDILVFETDRKIVRSGNQKLKTKNSQINLRNCCLKLELTIDNK